MKRRYPLRILINSRWFTEVIIDSHYEQRHAGHMNDTIILDLVKFMEGMEFIPSAIDLDGFEYFKVDPVFLNGVPYRLIWLCHRDAQFLGVRNAFRRKYGKKISK